MEWRVKNRIINLDFGMPRSYGTGQSLKIWMNPVAHRTAVLLIFRREALTGKL
ncbi:hypothetical protein [Parabacteroides bouchesdurhonensis]|uniref:hypothetical protein n=1 Tax=Parabacteroides bouchesdurhonensis TaxID=1936995 RepID=UPI0022DF84DE|nr:hypothetical protein [Parabacteroides bouchesdurhonensis]